MNVSPTAWRMVAVLVIAGGVSRVKTRNHVSQRTVDYLYKLTWGGWQSREEIARKMPITHVLQGLALVVFGLFLLLGP
jgi:hypothetical protein